MYFMFFYFSIFFYFINLVILINLYKNIFLLFIKNIFILFFLYFYKYYIIFIFFNSFKELISLFTFIKKLIKKEFFIFNFLKNNPEFIHIIQDTDFLNYLKFRESFYTEKLIKTFTPNGIVSTHNYLESIVAFHLVKTHDKNIDNIQFELNNKKEFWAFSKNSEGIFLKHIYPKKNHFDLYEIALNCLNKKEENNQKIKFINNFINKPSEYEELSIKDYLGNNSLVNINNLNLFNYNELITFFLIKYKDLKKDKVIIFINHMKNNEFNYYDIVKYKDTNNLN